MTKKKNSEALSNFCSEVSKIYGEGSVMKMNDPSNEIKTFSSGSLALDVALGGGFALGKIVEIYSLNMCGKSYRALSAAKEMHLLDREVLYLDHECALNLEAAEKLDVDIDRLFISQPSTAEEGFEIAKKAITSGEFGLIVFDSTNSMIPKAELEGSSGQAFVANGARLFSQAMKQLTGIANKYECTLLFISQTREQLGGYIPTKAVGVGNAVAYYASQRIEIKKTNIRKGDEIVGFTQKNKVIKNKVAPPFKTGEVTISFETGIDKERELLDVAIMFGIVDKKGSWISYSDTNIAQGVEKAADVLRDNPELVEEIEQKVRKALES